MTNIKKVIRDGKVGVLYSPGFGAGFYTWGAPLQAIFDPRMIELIEKRDDILQSIKQETYTSKQYTDVVQEIQQYVTATYEDVYTGGVEDLRLIWIDQDQRFVIEEYDGAERIVLIEDLDIMTA